jgi:Ni/Co efflux regulator RcnB
MRISVLAMIVAFGTTIAAPALAQQSAEPSQKMQPDQQMQKDADKGIKTRNSGESGYVSDQEKPGASAHAPGQPPDSNSNQTTGSSSARGSEAGGKSR